MGSDENLVDEGLTRAIGLSDIDADGTRRIEGIILLAFAPLGHAVEPRLLDDPLVVSIARRVGKTPAQVLLAWGIQRGTAVLTPSVRPGRIRGNTDVTALPENFMQDISERLETRDRFNSVVDAGEPGFIEVPQGS